MAYDILKGYEPAIWFKWFGAITEIPRGSRKEEAVQKFIMNFGKERGYECSIDDALNVFMRVPATPGYENEPAVLLQAHSDMVWEKDEGVDFDFEHSPINLKIEGDKLMGDGTTLGADNGVGTATMLALADTQEIPHPPLELLFTTAEEVGLVGIRKFDMSKITARRMLNMDCGYTKIICVCTAGTIKSNLVKDFNTQPLPQGWTSMKLIISGGKSGHSGILIGKERMCAVNTMAAILDDIGTPVMVGSLKAVGKSIFAKSVWDIAVPDVSKDKAIANLRESFELIKKIYVKEDPDIEFGIEESICDSYISEKDSSDLIAVMSILHTGAFRRDGDAPDTIVTSSCITRMSLEDGHLDGCFPIRSSNDKCAEICFRNYERIMEKYGMPLEKVDQYSGWPEKPESEFRNKFITAFRNYFHEEPEFERIHGGVEIGNIVGAIPDMDGVGYAPSAHNAHTTKEFLYLSQVEPFWTILKEVLATRG